MIINFLLLAIVYFTFINCVVLVPERANMTLWSDKYVGYARLYITRKSRNSPYYINMEGKSKHMWNNNVTLNIVFYEYLHNEYRRSFVEIHKRGCDLINKDPLIGVMLKKCGIVCPLRAGEYHLLNVTLPMEHFKYQFPFEKFRTDMDVTQTHTKEILMKGYFYGSFKTK